MGTEREALKQLPRSPDEAYNNILRRLDKQTPRTKEKTFQILSWILYAGRPLQLKEVCAAVNGSSGDLYNEDADAIVENCQGLIFHDKDNDIVSFVHGTVKVFLGGHIKSQGRFSTYFLSNGKLANFCLIYLRDNPFDTPCANKETLEERLERYNFARYAAQFWSLHTRRDGEKHPKICEAIIEVFENKDKRKAILQIENYAKSSWGNSKTPTRTRLIHVIAENGLTMSYESLLNDPELSKDRYVAMLVLEIDFK